MSEQPMIDDALARKLVDDQFPHWSPLPLHRVEPAGSDHVIFRLGDDLSVRLPRHDGAITQARKEAYWLPRLAPQLPLRIPEPVAVGEPDHGYPWPWAVCRWLEGKVATVEEFADSADTARDLAGFLTALHAVDLVIPPERRSELRQDALADRDARTRAAIAEVADTFDAAAMIMVWDAALTAPGREAPRWVHGDFHTGNLLAEDGRVTTVIDFGGFAYGDPAFDLMIAYTLLSPSSRAIFRDAVGLDDDTWARGRGWALCTGLNAYAAYAATHPRVAAQTTRQITQALIG